MSHVSAEADSTNASRVSLSSRDQHIAPATATTGHGDVFGAGASPHNGGTNTHEVCVQLVKITMHVVATILFGIEAYIWLS